MGKPSIFSRQYENRMRKRKKRIIVIIGIILLIIIGVVIFLQGRTTKNTAFNKIISVMEKKKTESKKEITTKEKPSVKEKTENQKEVEEKGYTIKLSNEQEIKAIYEVRDNEKKFKYIAPVESTVPYSISPSGKGILIFDDKIQNLWYIDIEGNKSDLSLVEYKSSDGTIFPKTAQLKINPNYLWISSPKFIDEENVAYISNLPWFNSENMQYVWIVNCKNKFHKYIEGLSGKKVNFQNISAKGLEVNIDTKIKFLKSSGEFVE